MIRVLHHMADAPAVLQQVSQVLQPKGVFLLEYANKLNFKAIARYLLRRQSWSPFSREPVEFIKLNFNFHPAAVRGWLHDLRFRIRRQLTVSHFRVGWLKKHVPVRLLVGADALFQPTGALWQLTPSVFVRAEAAEKGSVAAAGSFFKCPQCGTPLRGNGPETGGVQEGEIKCPSCKARWGIHNGIYNFKKPL
jgi:SAM-dependent methyltransferase